MKTVLFLIAIIAFCFGSMFIGNSIGLFQIKFFGTKMENARREVYENSQSYVDGKRQELLHYKMQYDMAKEEIDKKAIRYTVLHSLAGFDESKLDNSLQAFLRDLRN